MLKGPLLQHHNHGLVGCTLITRRKTLTNPVKIDMQGRNRLMSLPFMDLGSTAPRQELGVLRDVFHQPIHLFNGIHHQY
ncbi:hypothetical protein CARN8_7250004 [mine drainage metagenome]|uniref:Uncharacterized protein n=1 Tax=mine drainage metagenome TaxID=410659 RepID=A0A3P3ZRV4_9ZZZZ